MIKGYRLCLKYIEHRQLSRITSYQFQNITVIFIISIVAIIDLALLYFGLRIFAAVGSAIVLLWLSIGLFAKHNLHCPSCKKSFYGAFKLLMPYTRNCMHCNFCFVPDKAVSLRDDADADLT